MYKNTKKEDLLRTCRELGLDPPDTPTILQLKDMIESTPVFTKDPEFVKDIIATFVEERKEQHRLDEVARELELAKIRNNNSANNSAPATDLESYLKSVKTLSMPLPKNPENFNLFFVSLEKAFITKNVPAELKSEILLNILGETANSILLHIHQDEMCDYEKVKELVLNHFQPNAQECLQNFRRSQRLPHETHIQFASRLQTSFEYYCKIRNVSDFQSLCDLMVADKLFSTLDKETQSYISLRQNTSWFKPTELSKEIDTYFTSQRKSLSETNHRQQSYDNKNKANHYHSNRNKQNRGFYHRNNNNFRPANNSATANPRSTPPNDSQVCTIDTSVNQHKLQFADIYINNTKVTALIDSGAQISCVHERFIHDLTPSLGTVNLTGAFGNELEADLVQINISLPTERNNPITIIAAKCINLCHGFIIPPNVFEDLLMNRQHTADSNTENEESSLFSISGPQRDLGHSLFSQTSIKESANIPFSLTSEEKEQTPLSPTRPQEEKKNQSVLKTVDDSRYSQEAVNPVISDRLHPYSPVTGLIPDNLIQV